MAPLSAGSVPADGRFPGGLDSLRPVVRLVSVDIFDTVLTRTVGHPIAVFLLLGRLQADRGITPLSAEVFARARWDAEQRSRLHHGEATSYRHILDELAWALGLGADAVAALEGAELSLEERLLCAVPGAHAWLAEVRAGFSKAVFVSDTYFPTEFLQRQLVRHGLWQRGDSLYASWEVGREKRSARLYGMVARREGVRRRQLVHVGNNPHADGSAARRAGVRAAPATDANINRYEEILERSSFATSGLSSLFAGASRLARLQAPAPSPADVTIRDVAAGVAAPILVGYVLHVLRDAARRGIGRLYFVSRDGEVLLDIARTLAPKMGCEVDMRYLFGSRQAWNLPGLYDVTDEQLDWILFPTDFRSVGSVLARVALTPDDVEPVLAAAGFPAESWSANLDESQLCALGKLLQQQPLRGLVVARAAERRPRLQRYLAQEGLGGDGSYGIVDIGWFGRMGAGLSELLRDAGAAGPSVFYFMGLQGVPPARMVADRSAYLFDSGRGVGHEHTRLPGLTYLLEAFCTGTHGMVTGYEDRGGRIVPVLAGEQNCAAAAWGLGTLRATISRFVDSVMVDIDVAELDADVRPATVALLEALALAPTVAEAQVWGAFPFADDQTEAFTRTLAAPYRSPEVALALLLGRERWRTRRYWPAASRLLSNRVLDGAMGRPLDYSLRGRRKLMRKARDSLAFRREGR